MLDALTASLVDTLTAIIPPTWSIRDAADPAATALGVVLYYEQGEITTIINGQKVPANHVGVTYTLTIAAPEKDPVKGNRTATDALLDLLPGLDAHRAIFWDRAERLTLTTGEPSYRLEIIHIARYKENP